MFLPREAEGEPVQGKLTAANVNAIRARDWVYRHLYRNQPIR